jgi:hypothetical protein
MATLLQLEDSGVWQTVVHVVGIVYTVTNEQCACSLWLSLIKLNVDTRTVNGVAKILST